MTETSRSRVDADIKKNRLLISISSEISKKELEKIYTEIRFCLADLKPGFDVITDLSQCTLGHLNGLPLFRKIMAYITLRQPGEVIRVVGKSVLLKQLLMFASRFQGYKVIYVTTRQEAQEILDSPARRNGIRFHLLGKKVEYTSDLKIETGHLVDISTSGCAIQGPTEHLSVQMEISIALTLHMDREDHFPFKSSAQIVRVEKNLFAVRFLDLDDAGKVDLYQCLAYEAQRDIPTEPTSSATSPLPTASSTLSPSMPSSVEVEATAGKSNRHLRVLSRSSR